MRNMTASIIGTLELAIMECFWERDSWTSTQLLANLRRTRTIAHSTVTTTLARLYDQGVLVRERIGGPDARPFWRYTTRYATRSAFLAAATEVLAVQIGASRQDRAEALGRLLGVMR
jgi:predicted transcriptional regulator